MKDPRFRDDVSDFQFDVAGVREHVHYLDSPFGPITFTGKYGLPVKGPSERAFRRALELIEDGLTGRHVIDNDLVITVDGLAEGDRVSLLEGPGIGRRDGS